MGKFENEMEGGQLVMGTDEDIDNGGKGNEENELSTSEKRTIEILETSEELVVSSDEDSADATEEELTNEAFKLLNQFFDKNPELLKDLEPVKTMVEDMKTVRRSSRSVVGKVVRKGVVGVAARRARGCGVCSACRAPECAACRYCLDRPRRGGRGSLRQRCIQRVCSQIRAVK